MQSLRLCMLVMAIILASSAVSSTQAQQQQQQQQPACALKEAPQLHGFHLGMTLAEVTQSLADASMFESKMSAVNVVGSRAVNINGSELSPENGEGVENIYLTFVDNRVTHIKVTYNGAQRWDGSQDFFTRLSESLGLPKPGGPDAFQGSGENAKYIVECGEFNVTLAYAFGVSPNVSVASVVARKMVDERRVTNEIEPPGKTSPIIPRPPGTPPAPAPPHRNDPHPGQP